MKYEPERKALIGSIVLNLILGGAAFSLWFDDSAGKDLSTASGLSSEASVSASAGTAAANQPEKSAGFAWSKIYSDDWATYVANLRRTGCPEETVKDIFVAKINRQYGQRIAEARILDGSRNYWSRRKPVSSKMVAASQNATQEKEELLKRLLGIDLDQWRQTNDPEAERLYYLPEAKRLAFLELKHKYAGIESQIRFKGKGYMTTADNQAIEDSKKQLDSAISNLLTPEERFEFEVRSSPVADEIKRDLGAFEPTEAEFRALFQARQTLEQAAQSAGGGREPAEKEFEGQVRAALGDQRYAKYMRDKSADYQYLARFTDRFGLDAQVADQVFHLKVAVTAQAKAIMSDQTSSQADKDAALQNLRQRAQQVLSDALGEQAFAAYQEQSGAWLENGK